MKKQKVPIERKLSRFMIIFISLSAGSVACVLIYSLLSLCGFIACYKNTVTSEMNGAGYGVATEITVFLIFFLIVLYVCLSLWNLLSHRADEDSRMHCLPLLMSPIFLIAENGLLNLFDNGTNYYQVTMQVVSTIAVAVVTFASLKFSFEITSKRNRFNETSAVKPDIVLSKDENGNYTADITHNRCYLSGVFVGKIDTVIYRDIKRYGHIFTLKKLYFPNRKLSFEKDMIHTIYLEDLTNNSVNDICNYADNNNQDVFLIFRDIQNYYYFAQLPNDDMHYNVIGVNEYIISRLVYRYNKRKSENDIVNYEAMDWFKIPYNVKPN